MMKNNFFVVGSPLQILSAIEAIEYFSLKKYIIIVSSSDGANKDQMLDLIRLFKLKDIYWINKKKSSFFYYLLAYFRHKKTPFEYGFIGENGLAFRSLCFSLMPKYIYLLDDGISVYRERLRNEQASLRLAWKLKYGKFRFYRYFIFGMKVFPPVRVAYFSSILTHSIYGETVIHHRFENVSRIAKSLSNYSGLRAPSVVYLDSGLLDHGMVRGEFDYLMRYLRKKYENSQKIGYRPHRCQDNQLVKEVVDSNDFDYVENLRPVELDFILHGLPDVVIGDISSALITLKTVFPELKVIAIDFRKLKFISFPESDLDKIYQEFVSHGIFLDPS